MPTVVPLASKTSLGPAVANSGPKPNHVHGPGCNHSHAHSPIDRNTPGLHKPPQPALAQGPTLAGQVTKNVTEAVVKTSTGVAKDVSAELLANSLLPILMPIRMLVANPLSGLVTDPIVNWLATKLEKYAADNKIHLPMKPAETIKNLLYGDPKEFSEDLVKVASGFFEKAIPKEVTAAFASGNPLQIAKALGSSVTDGVKKFSIGSFLIKIANYIPFIKNMNEKYKPWVSGGLIFLFGGFAIRKLISLFKYVVLAGGSVMALKFLKDKFMGHAGSMAMNMIAPGAADHGHGGGGGALGALASSLGGGGGHGGGLGALAGALGGGHGGHEQPQGTLGTIMNLAKMAGPLLGGGKGHH